MDTQEMIRYKSILEQNRNEILNRVELLVEDKTRKNAPLSKSLDECAQEVENDEVIDQLEGIQLHKFRQIIQALERIDEGSYGTCLNCGNEIKKSRLEAIPFSAVCIECAH